MKPPFVLVTLGNGDTDVFDSSESLLGYVEPPDILNDEYVVFDSEGQALNLIATSRYYNKPIHLKPFEPPRYDITLLRECLMKYLTILGEDAVRLDEFSLDALIDQCWEYQVQKPGCWEQIASIWRPRRKS